MDLLELMWTGTVGDNKDSIIYYDSEAHERIFDNDGKSNGLFVTCCGGDKAKEQAFLEDVILVDPEENGCNIDVTDISASEGGHLVVELDHDSLVDVLKDRYEFDAVDEK